MTTLIGVSLKMYFTHRQALEWLSEVSDLLAGSNAVQAGRIEFFVMPTFPVLKDAIRILNPHTVGAQDVAGTDLGPYTGEVSAQELGEIGVRMTEIGHAERRMMFGESDEQIRAKCQASLRHGLVPLLCVGEKTRGSTADAAETVVAQAQSALLISETLTARVVLAYEPHWAIGAANAAPAEYIRDVCQRVRSNLMASLPNMSLIYGGSAGPGTLPQLDDAVDGLFLGRFAHDTKSLATVLAEADRP